MGSRSNETPPSTGQQRLPPIVERIQAGEPMPVCVLFVGMAGSGKTSLVTQLQSSLEYTVPTRTPTPTGSTSTTTATATKATVPDPDPVEKASVSLDVVEQTQLMKDQDSVSDQKQQGKDDIKVVQDDQEEEEEDEDTVESTAYCVNLDPATIHVPYHASIDIRDTVNYKQVMKQHQLGPNGAILTSLNLFATKFDQVLTILEQRAYGDSDNENTSDNKTNDDTNTNDIATNNPRRTMEYILVDTPGQIEAFTWSASGAIISESLASAFPTVLCFVVDTARCAASPNTFMSNMLYACSMLYRTRLPLVVCFNKTDVVSHEFCLEWMRDTETFQQALDDTAESSGFYGSLTRSLSLVLEEFYTNFANACGVSATVGTGIDAFWTTVQKAATQDFCVDYIEDLKNRMEEHEARRQAMAKLSVQRLQRDLDTDKDEDDEDFDAER